MKVLFYLLLSSFLFSQTCPQDTTGYQVIRDMTICYTKVNYNVEYHPECSCYYYTYTIISPENNKGEISDIDFEFETSKLYSPLDESLPFDPNCDELHKWGVPFNYSRKIIPLSLVSCPDHWVSILPAVGIFPDYPWGGKNILPGQSATIVFASKFPPAKRKIKIKPEDNDLWEELQDTYGREEEWTPMDANPPIAMGHFYAWQLDVAGPADPADLELYNGGGQKPDDVNLFLRYGNPKERDTTLPYGETTFELFIYYGKTTKPETFQATLNNQDIKNLFKPVPGGGDYAKLNLKNGTNVLEFSIDGIDQKGHIANDKDRLVLIVK